MSVERMSMDELNIPLPEDNEIKVYVSQISSQTLMKRKSNL